ncbi:MAG: GTPase ObgE [Spirochaetota bacterium]|nr:GTPase ObgE [Spirochaetota bacterium]
MSKFTDSINIRIEAGNGGSGAVSFCREKYIPRGGPDGGDGGAGGDVYIEADPSYHNLSHLFNDRIYRAENGHPGMGRNKHGRDGKPLIVKVSPGTEVVDDDTGEFLSDLLMGEERVLVGKGGVGGRGNAFFKSSTNQAPKYSQPGIPGQKRCLSLNLKLIADVGLVGLPNAGKSTLLSRITKAKPKIAAYPFTTLIPNLGVHERVDGTFYTIADIPGIIEGAHRGHGLGLSFLRHIERVKAILFLIDSTESNPAFNLQLLKSELKTYNEELLLKPYRILLTKVDLVDRKDLKKKIDLLGERDILSISSVTGCNIQRLTDIIDILLLNKDDSIVIF